MCKANLNVDYSLIWQISECGPTLNLEISRVKEFVQKIKGFQKLSLAIIRNENFFSEILRELARSKNEQSRKCDHTMTDTHTQVLLQVLVYDWIISGDIYARHPQISKVKEYLYRPKLLVTVHVNINAFELNRMINDVIPVVEFESQGERKYASISTQNDIEVPDDARRVQVGEKVDMDIDAGVEL